MERAKQKRLEEQLDILRLKLILEFSEKENYDGYPIVKSNSFTNADELAYWIMGQVNDIVKTVEEQ